MRRLSGMDAASVGLETEATPLHMQAVLVFDTSTIPGGYRYDRLRDLLAARIHVVPPLLQQLVRVPGGIHRPVWVDAPDLDWDYHLPRVLSTEPLDLEFLSRFAAELAGQRLDRSRPLWQLQVVEGPTDDRIALVARVHHALMDGLGGMEFMAELFELEPNAPSVEPPTAIGGAAPPSGAELVGRAVADFASMPAAAARFAREIAQSVSRIASQPRADDDTAPRPFTAPRTPFNQRLSASRAVSLRSLPFDTVREIAERTDSTVNDVVLAVAAGAVREYLLAHDALPYRRLVAGVPAAAGEGGTFGGNTFSFLFVRLPTDVAAPLDRLFAARAEAQRGKRAGEFGLDTLGHLLDLTTPPALDALFSFYRSVLVGRAAPLWNLIVSNVPGPPVPLYLGGARLVGMYPLGPVYDGIGLNVTVLSREDALDVGIVACRDLVADTELLAAQLADALHELAEAVGLHAGAPAPDELP